jgi:spore coat protein CotH
MRFIAISLLLAGCTHFSSQVCDGDGPDVERPDGWGRETHCQGATPNYDLLFDDTVVHRIDIVIDPEVHQAMQDDLEEKLGGGGPIGPGGVEDPIWVPVTVHFGGLTWWQVGMRYKGNSSLRSAYQGGVRKLAFRLQFDRFEDDHPDLDNQRFHGFRKMTFSNGFKDMSLMRDKISADVFRDAGVPAARGAFVRIHVDFGEGPTYFGLYTMIEDPSNKMLDTQFADDGGNLYKPEGGADGLDAAARWQTTDASLVSVAWDKKTNEELADWSDAIAAISALNADRSDAAAWRAGLEAVLDVDGFLRCLAISTTMVNWDSYGAMAHNYYVYSDPGRGGLLVWFPWDMNEIMLTPVGTAAHMSDPMLDGVTDEWPLVRHLLDDPVYRATYEAELRAGIEGAYDIETVQARMEAYHALIAPHVVGPEETESAPYTFLRRPEDFETSLTTGPDALEPWVEDRHAAVRDALGI